MLSCLGSTSGGGAVVARATIAALCARDDVTHVIALCSPGLDLTAHPHLERVALARETSSYAVRASHWSRGLARRARAARADVVVCMNGVGDARGLPQLVFLQQPHIMRSAWRAPRGLRGRVVALRALSRASCARAGAIVVQTPSMARAATRVLGVPEHALRVLTPGSGWGEDALGAWSPGENRPRRVLCVASTLSSKRVDVAARACARLGDVELRVTWPEANARALGARGLGALTRDALAREMARADALIMPSEVESLGLPLVEAMGVGLPVASVDLPYAREVCKDAAVYFRPGDHVDAARAIARALRAPRALHESGMRRHDMICKSKAYGAFAALACGLARGGGTS